MPQKSAYPAHSHELDDDEDDKPLVRSDRATVSEEEDDKPLVQPASRSETVKRESASIYEEEKDLQSGEIYLPHWNRMCQELRVNDQNKSLFGAQMQTVWHSSTLPTSCWMCAT